jgi:hypothetical protein
MLMVTVLGPPAGLETLDPAAEDASAALLTEMPAGADDAAADALLEVALSELEPHAEIRRAAAASSPAAATAGPVRVVDIW